MNSPTWDYLLELNQKRALHGNKFKEIFGVSIQKFWDIQTGFDIVKFDDWLKPPDNTSTKAQVFTQYGQRGVDMILALIGGKPDA